MADDNALITLRRHDHPGRLIAIDGTDGSGKTTMLDLAEKQVRAMGFEVVRTRQPTTEARELAAFQTFLYEPERRDEVDYRALLCMMIGDRLQHIHQVIVPALRSGAVVLCDRYIYTQIVTTRTRGFRDEPWMYELYQHVVEPDLGMVGTTSLEVACARISSRTTFEDSYLEREHIRDNQAEYLAVARHFGLTIVDTSEPDPEVAYATVSPLVAAVLPERAR